ncbi:MAG: CHRD domain-containing protein [Solirubrobacteraceae bacterium]
MHLRPTTVATLAAATLALGAVGASASMMSADLGAHLSGMGEHGVVNLKVTKSTGQLCWSFDLPMIADVTSAAIHTGTTGSVLLELGMDYTKTGCAKESAMTIEHLDAKPSSYSVWVNTKAHPGDLRGTLSAGMASM